MKGREFFKKAGVRRCIFAMSLPGIAAMPFVLLIFLVTAANALADDETRMRWDIVRVDTSTTPPTIAAGGTNTSAAADGSTISLTGSGTLVVGESDEVTGGGTWKTVAADGTVADGTYKATGPVRFDLAPGTFTLLPLLDGIGDTADARPVLPC